MTSEPPPERHPSIRPWVGGTLVVAISLLAYSSSLPGTFQYDDHPTILRNEAIRDPANLTGYLTDPEMFSGIPGNRMYRPLLLVTYLGDHLLAGYRPLVWHLTNIVIHALSSLLVMLLAIGLLRVFRPDRPQGPVPLLAGLAFALHPVHSEVVNYISARSGALATLGVLGALLLHLAWTRRARGATRVIALLGSGICLALGLGGKEIAIAAVPTVLVLELLDPGSGGARERIRTAVLRTLPLLAVAVGYLLLRKYLLGQAVAGVGQRVFELPGRADPYSGGGRTVYQNLITQARVFWMYVHVLLVPVDLAVDRFVRVSVAMEPAVIVSLIGLALVVAALVLSARRWPLVTLCGALFLFGLAPTSTIVPLNVVMNEHRLYLPGVGIAILTALALGGLLRRWPRAGMALAVTVAIAYAAVIVPRNIVWQDATGLWEANVRSSPRSFRGHNQLGAAYHGEAAKLGATEEALPWIERAIASLETSSELYPDWYHAHLNLGIVYRDRGRIRGSDEDFETALRHFRKCRELAENEWGARLQIATTYGLWKKYDEALDRFEAMAEEDREPGEPRKTIYLFPMAKLSLERGDFEAAERLYREIVATDASDLAGYEGLATVLGRAGRREEGVAVFEDLVRDRPGDPLVHVAYARFLEGLDPPDRRGAAAQFKRALGLGYPPSPAEFDRFLGN